MIFFIATTVRYDDCCIITDFSFLKLHLSVTSGEAVTFKVVNFISCSKREGRN